MITEKSNNTGTTLADHIFPEGVTAEDLARLAILNVLLEGENEAVPVLVLDYEVFYETGYFIHGLSVPKEKLVDGKLKEGEWCTARQNKVHFLPHQIRGVVSTRDKTVAALLSLI